MARTKGARGKKNVPTNKVFIDSLKQLSDKYLKRLNKIADDDNAPDTLIIKAAALVIGEAMLVMKHEGYTQQQENNKKQEAEQDKPKELNPFQPVVDFSLEKAKREMKF